MTSAPRTRYSVAFSLIEVTLSLGVVSFALLSVLALLPLGMKMIQESQQQQAIGNIISEVRGQAEQMSYSDMTNTTTTTTYYDINGSKELATLGALRTNQYYKVATYLATAPSVGSYTYASTNAVDVVVTITYPVSSAVSGTTFPWSKTITNIIFAARQAGK